VSLRLLSSPVAGPARRREEDYVVRGAVFVERPLAACIAMDDRAVLALVLVAAECRISQATDPRTTPAH
jgi:hypothetical protein